MNSPRNPLHVLGVPLSTRTFDGTIACLADWAADSDRARVVAFANAHMLAVAWLDDEFGTLLRSTDMNCIDGAPVALAGRYVEGYSEATRVTGPDLMPAFCRATAPTGLRHFFLGGAPGVAEAAANALQLQSPGMVVAGCHSPAFGPVTDDDLRHQCDLINASGANIVWVGLGCPKQERWMERARPLLRPCVLLGVGQAFNIQAGLMPRAPLFLRRLGQEWLFRLACEPGRLWKRYAIGNAVFLGALLLDQLLHLDWQAYSPAQRVMFHRASSLS